MTLRKKTLLIVGATNLILIAVLIVHTWTIVRGGFVRLEEQLVVQDVELSLSVLADEVATLDTMVADWAAWDDTYAFIEDADEGYIQSNLVDETLTGARLNLMLFLDSSGQVVFGKAFDLISEEEIPIPLGLQEHLSADSPLVNHTDPQSGTAGILLLPDTPMLVASRPILTSQEQGPIRGTLIMGRYLDSSEAEHLSRITHLSISLHAAAGTQAPPDVQTARASLSAETPILVQPQSADSIAGYGLLEDVYGNPALVLRVDTTREIYAQGQRGLLYFVLALVGTSLVLGAVVMLFMEKSVLSRLARLSRDVCVVGSGSDLLARVSVTGNDELAELAGSINETLSALERAHDRLSESEKRYRVLFDSGADLVLVSDAADGSVQGKFIEVNEVACQRLGYAREELLELTPLEIVASENRRDFPAFVEGVSAGQAAFFEAAIVARDGVEILAEIGAHRFEFDGRPAFMFILRDITARKCTEEALRMAENRFHDVAHTVGDWIWETDVNGRYIYVNRVVEDVLGYAPRDMVGTFIHDHYHYSDRERIKAQVKALYQREEMFADFTNINIHRDGREIVLQTTGLPLFDAEGNLVGYRGVHRDITAAQEMQRSLNAVYTLGRGLVLARDRQQIASTTVNAVRLMLRCHLCGLWLVDEERGEIVNHACLYRGQAIEAENLPMDGDKSIIGAAIQGGKLVYVPNVRKDSRFLDTGIETRSELCVPLIVEERVIGALNVESDRVDGFDATERHLVSALADYAALAIENAHLYVEMRAGRDRLQALSRRLAEVQESERRHIARELHDEIGQLLTGLKLILQMGTSSKTGPSEDEMNEALGVVDELLGRVRGLTLNLRATMLEDLGLLPALRYHFEHYTTQTGVGVSFKHVGVEKRRFAPEVETVIYRVAQEALTNVARHAGVEEVTVRLWTDQDRLTLQVEDRGVGFDVRAARTGSVSSGLSGMSERVELLGGHFEIESAPGSGTCITAELSIEAPHGAPDNAANQAHRT